MVCGGELYAVGDTAAPRSRALPFLGSWNFGKILCGTDLQCARQLGCLGNIKTKFRTACQNVEPMLLANDLAC